MRIVLAVDVGASNLRVALVDANGRIIESVRTRTPVEGGREAVANEILKVYDELKHLTGIDRVHAVGVGSIGPFDITHGRVVRTPNNPLGTFDLLIPLKRALNLPVWVVNDCVAAVWGEYLVGAGRGKQNVVYVTISSGIGAGAVVDGHLLLGKDGNAHEVGHIVLDYSSSIRCGCGGVGHWEGMASGNNLWKLTKELAGKWSGKWTNFWRKSLESVIRGEELFRAWRLGDEFASYVIEKLAEINAAGLASVINVYDPEVLTLGGAVILRNPDFVKKVIAKVRKYVMNREPEITLTPLGEDAVLVGAAMIAIRPPENLKKIQANV